MPQRGNLPFFVNGHIKRSVCLRRGFCCCSETKIVSWRLYPDMITSVRARREL